MFLCHAEDETEFVNYLYHLLQDESALIQTGVRIFGRDTCLEVGDAKLQTIRENLDAAIIGAQNQALTKSRRKVHRLLTHTLVHCSQFPQLAHTALQVWLS